MSQCTQIAQMVLGCVHIVVNGPI